VIFSGKLGNYSGRVEIASEGQEFGEAATYSIEESTRSGTVAQARSPDVVLTNLQFLANNISPYVTQITVGSLFVDYSPYTFSPAFGFKGLMAEGDIDFLNYHLFILKHRFDSFTSGARLKSFWKGWKMTGISVYYRETAKIPNAGIVTDGEIKRTDDLRLEEVQNDLVYTFDLESPLIRDRLLFGAVFGFNRYNQLASVDRSNAFEPLFGQKLEPVLSVDGAMVRGRFSLENTFLPGLKINYEYRNVNTQFKPRYRQSPTFFDDLESDQRGHNVRTVQTWRGFVGSVEYDKINRLSNKDFIRRRVVWALGYYGFDNLDFAFNQEIRKETYQFTSNRTGGFIGKNEKVVTSEIYMRAQLTPRLVFFLIPKRAVVRHPASGLRFANEILFGKLEFFATSNLRILSEFRMSHFEIKDFEPKGFPFADNFFRAKLEFNF